MTKRILYIEDDKDMITLMTLILSKRKYKVIAAEDGVVGLKYLEKSVPDLVLLDLMMPRMNGQEVIQVIRQTRELSHMPIVLISARQDEALELTESFPKGITAYIAKPFHVDDVLAVIDNALGKRLN